MNVNLLLCMHGWHTNQYHNYMFDQILTMYLYRLETTPLSPRRKRRGFQSSTCRLCTCRLGLSQNNLFNCFALEQGKISPFYTCVTQWFSRVLDSLFIVCWFAVQLDTSTESLGSVQQILY